MGFSMLSSSSQYAGGGGLTQKTLPHTIAGLIQRLGIELKCSICLDLYNQPVSTTCGHLFCRECVERHLRISTGQAGVCPICKKLLQRRALKPNVRIEQVVSVFKELAQAWQQTSGHGWSEGDVVVAAEQEAFEDWDTEVSDDDEKTVISEPLVERALLESVEQELRHPIAVTMKQAKFHFPTSPAHLPAPIANAACFDDTQLALRLTSSLIKGEDAVAVQTLALKLGPDTWSRVFEPDLTTHLITAVVEGAPRRTMKTMMAMLMGCWILPMTWVHACLEQGRLVDEESFEQQCGEGVLRCRQSHKLNEPPLLHGYSVYLYGDFGEPSRDEVVRLLRLAGAVLIPTVKQLKRKESVIVLCDPVIQHSFEKDAGILVHFRPLLATTWLLECISTYSIVDYDAHIVI